MIEHQRSEFRTVKQFFGPDARLVEHAPTTNCVGDVQVWLGSGMIGSGATFRGALADALAFTSDGALVKASSMLPAERSGVRATAEPPSDGDATERH